MSGYSIVSALALMCYVLLFSVIFASKKDKCLSAFLHILAVLILWTGGSLLMRVQAFPGIAFWYNVSLTGIWLSCFTLIRFMRVLAGKRFSLLDKILLGLTVALLAVNAFTGWFLAPPDPVTENGRLIFVYETTVGTVIMYLFMAFVAVVALFDTVRCYHTRAVTRQQFIPLLLGSLIMFAGQVIIMLPSFKGIPLDIAAGVVYAFCLFYALYSKRLFTLTLAFSRRSYCIITATILSIISLELAGSVLGFLNGIGGAAARYSAAILSIVAVGFALLLYALVKELSERLFLADERDRSSDLKAFSTEASRSLHAETICEKLCALLKKDFSQLSEITVAVESDGVYRVAASSSPLRAGQIIFAGDNPVSEWCRRQGTGVRVADFRHSIQYKSLWESERRALDDLHADYLFPLLDAGNLIGMVVLACRSGGRGLHSDDISFISSVNTVAAIAIQNSRMYEKACRDARTDALTGLLNRKYFLEELKQCCQRMPKGPISLVLVNLDDFKLYNQLYGTHEGDLALRRVAGILSQNAGENAVVARYGGKEFAMLLPGQESSAALRQAENLREQIYNMNRVEKTDAMTGSLSVITCSVGICTIPYAASNAKQLLDNTEMTVSQVKRSGKNAVLVCAAGPNQSSSSLPVPPKDYASAYSELAQTIYALTATIDAKDHYTFTHSNNVAYYAKKLAEACGLDAETVEIIREAALLHDIGKISIPEAILNKPAKLTADEYDIIQKHPENAVAIIRHLPQLDYLIPAVISHHERWDGKGYPRRLSGEDIPLGGRILCVADCFDAMTSRRCYQDVRTVENALTDLEVNAGKQFDPELVRLFVRGVRCGEIELQAPRSAFSASSAS